MAPVTYVGPGKIRTENQPSALVPRVADRREQPSSPSHRSSKPTCADCAETIADRVIRTNAAMKARTQPFDTASSTRFLDPTASRYSKNPGKLDSCREQVPPGAPTRRERRGRRDFRGRGVHFS